MTSLLRPSAPEWFRVPISEYLSLLPLRPRGVRHAIEFIAASYHVQTASGNGEGQPSRGPSLSPQGLMQASRLLSSVPVSLTPEMYFTQLASQLLSILDGEDGPDMTLIAAYIISGGILSKKTFGAPGSIGWRLFAEPQLLAINPRPSFIQQLQRVDSQEQMKTITSQGNLSKAVKRLLLLVQSHPSPALTGRLIRPLLIPLWGLTTYDKSSVTASYWIDTVLDLLTIFLKRCGTLDHLILLSSNLLWDGTLDWTFGPGSEGGIEIRGQEKGVADSNIIEQFSKIQGRITKLTQLISKNTVDDDTISRFFLYLSRAWLLPQSATASTPERTTLVLDSDTDPILKLAQAQLTHSVLQQFGDKFAARPEQVLELIEQLLQQTVQAAKQDRKRKLDARKATLSSLSTIVDQDESFLKPTDTISSPLEQAEDLVATAVSLLNTLISKPNFHRDKSVTSTLNHILSGLQSIVQNPPQYISESTASSIDSSITLIKKLLTPSVESSHQVSARPLDQEIFAQITSDFSSDLPPVRALAIHALQKLILAPDVQLDVPTLSLLLLSSIRSEKEEYVYLAAINALVKLAVTRDLGYACRSVMDSFQDTQESTGLEGRLRIGEALTGLVDAMSEDTSGQHADNSRRIPLLRSITEITIAVAGRRGQRTREAKDRERSERIARIKQRQAERAWGGEVPDLAALARDEDEDIDLVAQEQDRRDSELIQGIVKSWEDTGLEEDVRLRTSALSILGQILERATVALTPMLVNSAADISLSVMSFERDAGKAILRRAAVLVFMSLLRAMDKAYEEGTEIAVGLDGSKWLDVEKVLSWITEVDDDDMVKGHAGSVLESLEAWRMKKIIGSQTDDIGANSPSFGLNSLRGLSVNPVNSSPSGRLKIEEVE